MESFDVGSLGDLNIDSVLANSVSVLPEDPSELWSNSNISSSPTTPPTPFSSSSATELTPPPSVISPQT